MFASDNHFPMQKEGILMFLEKGYIYSEQKIIDVFCTSLIFDSRHDGHCRATSQHAEYCSHFDKLRILRLCQFCSFSAAKECMRQFLFQMSSGFYKSTYFYSV